MSYRSFKRILGETSLERKCRWLLGAGVLVLMSASFYGYAYQTEDLAYDQLIHTARAHVPSVVASAHLQNHNKLGLDEYQVQSEKGWPKEYTRYQYRIVNPYSTMPERRPEPDDLHPLAMFFEHPESNEYHPNQKARHTYVYFAAVRASRACVECHQDTDRMSLFWGRLSTMNPIPELKEGDLLAMVRLEVATEPIESGFHQNRAWLITFAVGTTVLILAGIYVIIRYVIVKPVKHLKAVADAIAAGQLNVRSEIQTGDEFEDLSDAFNRMLRNLTNMQDRNRTLILDLDRKVDELARLNMALFESDRLKGDFLATMSHELRTPLNSIIGFSEHLLSAENLSEKQHRWAANIMTGGQQLLALINDILDLAKMEAGKLQVRPETLKPADLCERSVMMFRPQAEKRSIDLLVEVPEGCRTIRQDAGKIGQILHNLVSNAIKFTPEGGRVTLAADVVGDQAVFTITDTGVGIAPEEQGMIFDKFRQASNPLTREQSGTGLGLSIVRELAKLLGGDVTLRSDLGRGSTFTVRIAAHLKNAGERGT